jgi:hypothetical protein
MPKEFVDQLKVFAKGGNVPGKKKLSKAFAKGLLKKMGDKPDEMDEEYEGEEEEQSKKPVAKKGEKKPGKGAALMAFAKGRR